MKVNKKVDSIEWKQVVSRLPIFLLYLITFLHVIISYKYILNLLNIRFDSTLYIMKSVGTITFFSVPYMLIIVYSWKYRESHGITFLMWFWYICLFVCFGFTYVYTRIPYFAYNVCG